MKVQYISTYSANLTHDSFCFCRWDRIRLIESSLNIFFRSVKVAISIFGIPIVIKLNIDGTLINEITAQQTLTPQTSWTFHV